MRLFSREVCYNIIPQHSSDEFAMITLCKQLHLSASSNFRPSSNWHPWSSQKFLPSLSFLRKIVLRTTARPSVLWHCVRLGYESAEIFAARRQTTTTSSELTRSVGCGGGTCAYSWRCVLQRRAAAVLYMQTFCWLCHSAVALFSHWICELRRLFNMCVYRQINTIIRWRSYINSIFALKVFVFSSGVFKCAFCNLSI